MTRVMTEAEFNEWKSHPGTLAVMEILSRKRDEMRRAWEGGSFTDYDQSAMALVNVGNIGTCKGYAFVQDLDYETYQGECDDAESIGPRPARSGGVD